LAGILDGEGSISAQTHIKKLDGCLRITPFISIVNSEFGIVTECRAVLTAIGAKYRDCNKPLSGDYGDEFKGSKKCANIRVDGQQPVELVCRAVLPYLRSIKRENAKKLLEYIQLRKDFGFQRDALGRVRRCEYSLAQIELICSIRTHPRAMPFEEICKLPNVVRSPKVVW
jgi:hypothetical protein